MADLAAHPVAGLFVIDVIAVQKGQQHIDIQQ